MADTNRRATQGLPRSASARLYIHCCSQFGATSLLMSMLAQQAYSFQPTGNEVVIGVISHHCPHETLRQWSATAEYVTCQIPDCDFTIQPVRDSAIDHVCREEKTDCAIDCPSQHMEREVLHVLTRIATMKTRYTSGHHDVYSCVLFWASQDGRTRHDETEKIDDKKLIGTRGKDCAVWHAASWKLLRYGFNTDEYTAEVRFVETGEDLITLVREGQADLLNIRSSAYEDFVSGGYVDPVEFTIFHKEEEGHASVVFIHSTTAYPELALAKLKHVNDCLAERVMVALIELSDPHIAAESAECGGWTVPSNYQVLHECLKVLRIDPYEDYGKTVVAGIFSQYEGWIICTTGLCEIHIFNLNNRLIVAKRVILDRKLVEISDRTQGIRVDRAIAALHLYGIIQEVLQNSIKNGKAKDILMRLQDDGDSLTLYVKDAGFGFLPEKTNHNGMRLHLMKYRAKSMHGDLVVFNNGLEGGVVVQCSVPKGWGILRETDA